PRPDTVGDERGDGGPGAGPDINIKIVDREAVEEIVERRETSDLIHPAGDSPAGQDERPLCAVVSSGRFRPGPFLFFLVPDPRHPPPVYKTLISSRNTRTSSATAWAASPSIIFPAERTGGDSIFSTVTFAPPAPTSLASRPRSASVNTV